MFFNQIKFNSNPCDHGWSELILHFTKKCDNKCPFCISKNDGDIGFVKPDVNAICKTIEENKSRNPYIIINGGEPMLYMEELNTVIDYIKSNTTCKVYVFTSLPKTCLTNFDLFKTIISKVDGIIFSVQHYKDKIADKIRGVTSKYDRKLIYAFMPTELQDKVTISINICKPYFKSKEDVYANLRFFYDLGYRNFKLVEIKNDDEYFIDIPKLLGIKVKSPFAYKCSPEFPLNTFITKTAKHDNIQDGVVKLNLTCFLKNPTYKTASLWDIFKAALRPFFAKHGHLFGVVYEDGSIHPYWLKK